ncbi:MAG: chorismate mutase [Firmicutes bacterium]|nr:chorismate mutase [Bacillota bacterium]
MDELEKLRQELASIDRELLEQFSKRMGIAGRVARYKERTREKVYVPEQEARVLARAEAQVPEELGAYVGSFVRTLMRLSRERQYELLIQTQSSNLGGALENVQTRLPEIQTLSISPDLPRDCLTSLRSRWADASLVEAKDAGKACRRVVAGSADGAVLPLDDELLFLLEKHALYVQACLSWSSERYVLVGSELVWPAAGQSSLLVRIKGKIVSEALCLVTQIFSDLGLNIVHIKSLSDASLFLEFTAASSFSVERALHQIQQEAGEIQLVGCCL